MPSSVFRPSSISHQNVRDGGCAVRAEGLRQPDARVSNLIRAGLTAQLLHGFDDLIDARRAAGIASTLQPAQRADRRLAVANDAAALRKVHAAAAPGEAARF